MHYRLFYATTTQWCPEREEHGYFYAPIFKCSTNPRVATAHRWSVVDVISRMNKPTECFFNKDGIWYYAGVYKAFRMADLTTKEWAELPSEVRFPSSSIQLACCVSGDALLLTLSVSFPSSSLPLLLIRSADNSSHRKRDHRRAQKHIPAERLRDKSAVRSRCASRRMRRAAVCWVQ